MTHEDETRNFLGDSVNDEDDPDELDDDGGWCELCGEERPCECDDQLAYFYGTEDVDDED